MANNFVPSGRGAAIVIGAGGVSSDLVAATEYVDFFDTASIRDSLNSSVPLTVTVTGFTVSVQAWPFLVCTSVGTSSIVFRGYHSTTFRDTWVSRDTEPIESSTTSIGVGAWPDTYYAGYKYVPDPTPATSVTWTIFTSRGTFTATQRVINNWNRTRDYVRPFVRRGTMETLDGEFVTFYGTYTSTTTSLNVSGFTVLYGSSSSSPSTVRVILRTPYQMTTGQIISNTITSTGVNHFLANGNFFVGTASSLASTSFTFTVISPGIIETTSLVSTLTSITIAARNAVFDIIYNTPAATSSVSDYVTYTIPDYCSSVSFVCVGGGGQGGASKTDELGNAYSGGGGGGGGLRYRNNYAVTKGTVLRIHVGDRGYTTQSSGKGEDGDQSFVATSTGAILVFAGGGGGGAPGTSSSATNGASGTGSAVSSSPPIGGGNGGLGGFNATAINRSGGGGGGAGGYADVGLSPSIAIGGSGGAHGVQNPTAGSEGAGGGGFSDGNGVGGGGGVGLGGHGSNGAAGARDVISGDLYAGQGGSYDGKANLGGIAGDWVVYFPSGGSAFQNGGGEYGAGGYGNPTQIFGDGHYGQNGAVRIMSGEGRTFPYFASSYQSPYPGNSSYVVTTGTEIIVSTPLLGEISVTTTTYQDE